MLLIDNNGKITISLGGKCPLGCKHCYTNTSSFVYQPIMSPKDVIEELSRYDEKDITTICVSGDTDCFIDASKGLELLSLIVRNYFTQNIMFTTRLVPNSQHEDSIVALAHECLKRKQLFIPCISIVSYSYPNTIENPLLVPPSKDRLDFLIRLSKKGIPCFLTLRPTFPFSIVPLEEIERILDYVGNAPASLLGEVFLIDQEDEIARRLNLPPNDLKQIIVSSMTFIKQPTKWKKQYLKKEFEAIQNLCKERGLPFFLRSMSAINYINQIIIFKKGWRHNPALFNIEIDSIYP